MKRILLNTCLASLMCCAAEISLGKLEWSNVGQREEMENGRPVMVFDVAKTAKGQKDRAQAALDVDKLRGRIVQFSIRARGENVSQPLHKWNGVKFMVMCVSKEGGVSWPAAGFPRGTFDWMENSFFFEMSENIAQAFLMIGLEESTGKVVFDLNSLKCNEMTFPDDDYQATYSENVRNTPPLRGVMSPNPLNLNQYDLLTLKQWNVNLVRFQICRHWGQIGTDKDLKEYNQWFDQCLDNLAKLCPDAHRLGIRFVIDLHWPPGGRTDTNEFRMFYEKEYFDAFVNCWRKIATRFKGNPAIWGYDLINEPIQNNWQSPRGYWEVQELTAKAVREIDPDTPIIIESNQSDSPYTFLYLPTLKMNNVIYQVHMYVPGQFTHQGVHDNPIGIKYPGKIGGKMYDKEELRKAFKHVLAFQKKHNCRIYVGEFSAAIWAPGAEKYLEDCISIFEEYGWDWTYHAFREATVWSLEHEGTPKHRRLSLDNPRLQTLKKGWAHNK
ncbi:MAG: cellulase family glycosylhydrolase [Victivallales bacterium]|nr:cellulase family glycosylhydrolase [Victivallales bacterium]